MRKLRIVMMLALVALALSACRQAEPTPAASSDILVTLEVQPQPPATGNTTLLVTVTTADGAPVTGAEVAARGDMSHAGMAPVIASSEDDADGVYRIPFEWTMAGDWFVDVTVTLADGREVVQRFDLSVSGAMMHDTMATEPADG